MKNYFLFLILIFLSCSLIQPSYILIKNESEYAVAVTCGNSNKENLELKKDSHDYFLVCPGYTEMIFSIEEIGFKKKYELYINYLENIEFKFNLNK